MKRLVDVKGEARRICAAAAAMILLAAGCGGGDPTADTEASSTVAATITKAELIKKGDAICRKTDQIQRSQMNAYTKKHPEALKSKSASEKALVAVAFPPIAVEIEELSALGAPEGDEAELTAILTGLERALRAVERKPATVLRPVEGPFLHPDKLAAKYGFKDCAQAL